MEVPTKKLGWMAGRGNIELGRLKPFSICKVYSHSKVPRTRAACPCLFDSTDKPSAYPWHPTSYVKCQLKNGLKPIFALTLLLLLFAPAVMSSGERPSELEIWWTIKESLYTPGGKAYPFPDRINIAMKANLVRLYDLRGSKMFIFNMDNERFWLANYRWRTLSEGTLDELRSLYAEQHKKDAAKLKKIESSLDKYSGTLLEKRRSYVKGRKALMEIAAARLNARSLRVQSKDVNGHKAKTVEILIGRKKVATVWVAADIEPPARWKKFVELMAEIEPQKWKVIAIAERIPLRVKFNYAGVKTGWELQRFSARNVSLKHFLLPNKYRIAKPKLD